MVLPPSPALSIHLHRLVGEEYRHQTERHTSQRPRSQKPDDVQRRQDFLSSSRLCSTIIAAQSRPLSQSTKSAQPRQPPACFRQLRFLISCTTTTSISCRFTKCFICFPIFSFMPITASRMCKDCHRDGNTNTDHRPRDEHADSNANLIVRHRRPPPPSSRDSRSCS